MKISVITVCFNSEKTIEKTINSVISQNNKNYEYIIVDGFSSDKTNEIIGKYKKNIKFWISEKDSGIYDAINKGIKKSTGDIISILHSDDIYNDNNTLNYVSENFNKDLDIEMLIGNTLIKDKNTDKILRNYSSTFFKPSYIKFGYSPPHPSTFIKKSLYNKFGLYNLNYEIASDFDLFARLILKNKIKYKLIDRPLVLMNSGGKSSKSLLSNYQSSKEILKSLSSNNIYSNWFFVLFRFPLKVIQYFVK